MISGMENERLRFWRSPSGQPGWARPTLIGIAALAGLLYAWELNGAIVETVYGAAARSMSASWHDFFFGAFDPFGTVTVDKLPGALWVQAVFLRLFGFHVWVVVLPQVLEGVLTVLVLYRAVRRLAGPSAGIAAAGVLAISPVTVALNRGNVADSLLILLTVLAADATCSALLSGRLRTLMLAGVWVGLAFQAKMLQAWLILPALTLAYLVAAPASLRVRLGHVFAAGAVTLVVSLSWMSVVSLIPAHERPYVDGTHNDSVFSQVFDYNGVAHLGNSNVFAATGPPPTFLVSLFDVGSRLQNPVRYVGPSWHRLLTGELGRDDGWLLPIAAIAAIAILLARRHADRRDPLRACVLLWGTWFVVLSVFFSLGSYLNSYYVAALAPATAGLCGAGMALLWELRAQRRAHAALVCMLLVCVGYGVYLLNGATRVPGWLVPAAICIGVASALAVLLWRRSRGRGGLGIGAIGLAVAGICFLPAVTSALVSARRLGPFEAPFGANTQPASPAVVHRNLQTHAQLVDQIAGVFKTPVVFAADSSLLAAPYIFATGREVLPIGGYLGNNLRTPTLAQIQQYLDAGQVRGFLVPPVSEDPRIAWILGHCTPASKSTPGEEATIVLYSCAPS
jgi:4-amino-4-deoxy-L-arabinose transferase-like glycosyltransferase